MSPETLKKFHEAADLLESVRCRLLTFVDLLEAVGLDKLKAGLSVAVADLEFAIDLLRSATAADVAEHFQQTCNASANMLAAALNAVSRQGDSDD
jgi:hypothetical protein